MTGAGRCDTRQPDLFASCSTVLDEAKAKFAERANTEVRRLADETRKYLPDSALLDPVPLEK